LAIGIDWNTFWELNPKTARIYAKAFKQRKDEEIATINYTAWLNGLYIRHAVVSAFSDSVQYYDKPLSLTAKKTAKEEATVNTEAVRFSAWSKVFNQQFKQKHPELENNPENQ
jgi:hypothetical protein